MDAAEYIKSARQFAQLIVVVGLIAMQMSWSEHHRLHLINSLGYFEKVFKVQKTLVENDSNVKLHKEVSAEVFHHSSSRKLEQGIQFLVDSANSSPFVKLKFDSTSFATLLDPSNECDLSVYRGPAQENVKVTWWPRKPGFHHKEIFKGVQIPLNDVYIVQFLSSFDCDALSLHPSYESFMCSFILVYLRSENEWLVYVDKDVLRSLGRSFSVAADSLRTLELEDIRADLLQITRVETGKVYPVDKLEEAFSNLYEQKLKNPSILGFTMNSTTAALFLPLALFFITFSFWHRLRRIPDNLSKVSVPPWIMLNPKGPFEFIAAIAWAILLIGAVFPVLWVGWMYIFQVSWLIIRLGGNNLQNTLIKLGMIAGFIGLLTEILVILSLGHIFRINIGRGLWAWTKSISHSLYTFTIRLVKTISKKRKRV